MGILAGGATAAVAVLGVSNAAFTATTENTTNSWSASSLSLVDDDLTSAMFEVTGLVPGDTEVRCIEVEYTGDTFKVTPIKMYAAATTDVDNFASHLDVTVEQGSGATFGDCSTFTSSATLINNETLAAVTSTYTDFASGVGTFVPTSGSVKVSYRFTVTLGADTPDTAQGDSAGANFTWEIQSA